MMTCCCGECPAKPARQGRAGSATTGTLRARSEVQCCSARDCGYCGASLPSAATPALLTPSPPTHPVPIIPALQRSTASCADVERAFAQWQASPQALVGFFPRLVETWTPAQVRTHCGADDLQLDTNGMQGACGYTALLCLSAWLPGCPLWPCVSA